MSSILFCFLGALTQRRDILIWQEENEKHAKKRFVKQTIQAAAQDVANGAVKVRWGWMDISKTFVTLCIVDYEPTLDPRILRESCSALAKASIMTFPGKDCHYNDRSLLITPSVEITSCLAEATDPSHLTGDFDADTRIQVDWDEPNPIDLHAYERIGLSITNIQHLVPPGRPRTSYHIPAPIGTLVGEVPAIAIDLLDQQQIRFAYRSTSLLRQHYGAVRLVATEPLDEAWRGQRGKATLRGLLPLANVDGAPPLENLSSQRLSSLVNLTPKDTPVPKLFPKRCKESRYQGVIALFSELMPFPGTNFTYASVWDQPAPDFAGSTEFFTPQAYSLLSHSSLNALAFLPLGLKQNVKPAVQAWYLAGVGSDDENRTVLQRADHPYAGTLASLPQTLVIAAMLRHYIDDRESYKGSIRDHFDTLYADVIKTSPGIVDSWTYFGTRGSFFPFHQEDALLPSANLLVLGDSKVWIFVTGPGMEILRTLLADYIQPCYMLHRSIFFHPAFLAEHNIPFTIAVQSEGELILADARSGHQGWNMGPNLAEAVNYADLAAMEYQKEELYHDGMAVWPCVCGTNPVPTDPTQKSATSGKAIRPTHSLYRPEWAEPDDLGCCALYQWVDTLLTQMDPTSPSFISAKLLLELRDYVYRRAEDKGRMAT